MKRIFFTTFIFIYTLSAEVCWYPGVKRGEDRHSAQCVKYGDIKYQQFKDSFCPWLSIIDVMMFNSVERIQEMLNNRVIA